MRHYEMNWIVYQTRSLTRRLICCEHQQKLLLHKRLVCSRTTVNVFTGKHCHQVRKHRSNSTSTLVKGLYVYIWLKNSYMIWRGAKHCVLKDNLNHQTLGKSGL